MSSSGKKDHSKSRSPDRSHRRRSRSPFRERIKYNPPPNIEGTYTVKVKSVLKNVEKIASCTGDNQLRSVFSKFGKVADVYVPYDKWTRKRMNYAYVRYYSKREAEKAIGNMDRQNLDGNKIRVIAARYGRPCDERAEEEASGSRLLPAMKAQQTSTESQVSLEAQLRDQIASLSSQNEKLVRELNGVKAQIESLQSDLASLREAIGMDSVKLQLVQNLSEKELELQKMDDMPVQSTSSLSNASKKTALLLEETVPQGDLGEETQRCIQIPKYQHKYKTEVMCVTHVDSPDAFYLMNEENSERVLKDPKLWLVFTKRSNH